MDNIVILKDPTQNNINTNSKSSRRFNLSKDLNLTLYNLINNLYTKYLKHKINGLIIKTFLLV